MADLNLWAILAAALSSFLLGGLWYSPAMFWKLWVKETGQQGQQGHPAMVFALSFLFALLAAIAFAWWLGPAPALDSAVYTGLIVGGCFVGSSFGINYLFAERGWMLWAIDAGYHLVQFLLYGLILGLWH